MRPLEAGHEYVVLASSIPACEGSSAVRFFRGATAVRKQLEGTVGVIGFSPLARPLRRQYATLSVWEDDAALAAFAGGQPHKRLMDDLSPEMRPTNFVRWKMTGSEGQPTWAEAFRRLA